MMFTIPDPVTLPRPIVDGLTSGRSWTAHPLADMDDGDVNRWLSDKNNPDLCTKMEQTLDHWLSKVRAAGDDGGAHDSGRDGAWAILGDAHKGHSGVSMALAQLRSAFLTGVAARRGEGTAKAEWKRAVFRGVQKVSEEEGESTDDPCLDMQEKKAPGKPPISGTLMSLVDGFFTLGQDHTGKPFAVQKNGPNVRLPINGPSGLIGKLRVLYRKQTGKVPSNNALADVRQQVESQALQCEAEEVPIRTYYDPNRNVVIVDMGDESGRAIQVDANGWSIIPRSPVTFWRTNCTLPYEFDPIHANGSPHLMRKLFNFSDQAWNFLVNWQVIAFISGIAHPMPVFDGPPGRAKTASTRLLVDIIDPSKASLNGPPHNEDQLMVSVNGSWAFALENVSVVGEWMSDSLARLITGAGARKRALYTDDDVHVINLQRVLILNGVEPVGLRPDLLDRSIRITPRPITESERLTDESVRAMTQAAAPAHLGYLLDILSAVLKDKKARAYDGPVGRMADFDEWLYHCDRVRGTNTLPWWTARRKADVIAEAVDDILVRAITKYVALARGPNGTGEVRLSMSAAEWLDQLDLSDSRPKKGMPGSARSFTQRMRLHQNGLRAAGWEVREGSSHGRSWWKIVPPKSPE